MPITAQPDHERLVVTIVFEDLGGGKAFARHTPDGQPLIHADRAVLADDPAARGAAFRVLQGVAAEHGFTDS